MSSLERRKMSRERQATRSFRAMATTVNLRVLDPSSDAEAALDRAEGVFRRVESACTRFDPSSPLMLANAEPRTWHDVPKECARAVEEAARAHVETAGVFDPRVLDALVGLGYDHTRAFAPTRLERTDRTATDDSVVPPISPTTGAPVTLGRWRPRVEYVEGRHRIRLDGTPIDLGGIGKGLAVRWAAETLAGSGSSVLVEAGGDCQLSGIGPGGGGWLVGIEDPFGGSTPLAVVAVADLGCATSSVRLRRWVVDGREVHHLIDPRTGLSGGQGLAQVTVLHRDVAWAEVWSKTLFLLGPDRIADAAQERGLVALWVEPDGRLRRTEAADEFVVWEGDRVSV